MTIYRDPEYERMQKEEWFNLALGEMRFSLYERLTNIDQRIDVPEHISKKSIKFPESKLFTINSKLILNWFLENYGITDTIEQELIKLSFALKIHSNEYVDLRDGAPKIYLTIDIDKMKESVIENLGLVAFNRFRFERPSIKILNVIIDVLAKNPNEVKTMRKSKQGINKAIWVANAISLIISENKWNIKDIDLMIKLVHWFDDYMHHESIYALSMISRLKAMSHFSNPIYSVEGA
jgi:hypothetical protein